MSLICLLAGGAPLRLAAVLTLAWTHSVQKTTWEEDWQATPAGLVLTQMRVEGSGAGMEPPDGAVRESGREGVRYVHRPPPRPLPDIVLRRSGATADWRVCMDGACRPMGDLLADAGRPADADPVMLTLCSSP